MRGSEQQADCAAGPGAQGQSAARRVQRPPCQDSAFWHRPQWGGDAFWPGHRVPSLDLAPVLASPGENLGQGPGLLASERLGAPGITNRDDASPDVERFVTRGLEYTFVSLVERGESVFGGTWA